jgi:hypothetical protein
MLMGDQSKEGERDRACSMHGRDRKCIHSFFVRKLEGKECGKPSWKDNIKMDVTEIVSEFEGSIHLAQVRDRWLVLVNRVVNLWVPWKAGNFLTSQVIISLSRKTLLCGVSCLI